MREPKNLNQNGNQQGQWFLNRFDYFEFYGFEGERRIKLICVIACVLCYLALLSSAPFYLFIPLAWIVYISALTLYILHKKVCKYHGYFLYPARFIKKFKRYEKQIDMQDFDSVASMNNHKD